MYLTDAADRAEMVWILSLRVDAKGKRAQSAQLLSWWEKKVFIPFPRALAWNETQTASPSLITIIPHMLTHMFYFSYMVSSIHI